VIWRSVEVEEPTLATPHGVDTRFRSEACGTSSRAVPVVGNRRSRLCGALGFVARPGLARKAMEGSGADECLSLCGAISLAVCQYG
jgi:hypothetical protein